jgi:hypothetical protein
MKYLLMTSILTLALSVGSAHAQVSSETTTQSTVAPAPVPQPGVLSTERETHAVDATGNRVDSHATTYRDANGVIRDSKTTQPQVTPPPPPATTSTSTTSTSTSNVPN